MQFQENLSNYIIFHVRIFVLKYKSYLMNQQKDECFLLTLFVDVNRRLLYVFNLFIIMETSELNRNITGLSFLTGDNIKLFELFLLKT